MKRVLWPLFFFCVSVSAQASPHNVYGVWLSEAKDGHIEISDCGDGTPCGNLIWIDRNKSEATQDIRNKNKDLRGRPLMGVPIVWNFKRSKKGWKSGKIYNPEDGKTFSAHMKLRDMNHLRVKGCKGPLCISNIWTRLPASELKITETNINQLNERP